MSYAEDQHYYSRVFQRTDQAVISDTVLPESAQGALKSCSDLSRIVQFLDALAEKIQNSIGNRPVELTQLFQRGW